MAFPHEDYALKQSAAYSSAMTAPDVIPMSPLINAANVLNKASDLASAVMDLADRIVGSIPTPVANGSGLQPAPTAAFQALNDSANRTDDRLSDAFRALSRIQSQLP